MNAPDKIYLWRTGDYISKGWKQKQKNINHEIEYIRKDALLEWAKEKAKFYEGTANIRRSFEMMIRKIESL